MSATCCAAVFLLCLTSSSRRLISSLNWDSMWTKCSLRFVSRPTTTRMSSPSLVCWVLSANSSACTSSFASRAAFVSATALSVVALKSLICPMSWDDSFSSSCFSVSRLFKRFIFTRTSAFSFWRSTSIVFWKLSSLDFIRRSISASFVARASFSDNRASFSLRTVLNSSKRFSSSNRRVDTILLALLTSVFT